MSNTKPYVLPVSLEACIEHIQIMKPEVLLTRKDVIHIGLTYNYIKKHMQMLGGQEELIYCDNCGKPTKHISTGEMCEECLN